MDRELRRDPLTGRWVALCEPRIDRRFVEVPAVGPCDFCCGIEADVIAVRGEARAVAHRTPALRVEAGSGWSGPHRREALGCHEVLIEAAAHDPVADQDPQVAVDALRLARDRHRDLWQDQRLSWLGWERDSAGHPLATVAGAAIVPDAVAAEAAWGGDLATVIDESRRDGRRWLHTFRGAAAFCPSAPQVPFEVLVVPPQLRPLLAQATDEEILAVAVLLRCVEQSLDAVLGPHARRVRLHQPPRDRSGAWYLRVLPVLGIGGSDLAGALPSHPAFPEASAARLRALWHDADWESEPGEVRR